MALALVALGFFAHNRTSKTTPVSPNGCEEDDYEDVVNKQLDFAPGHAFARDI
jgi:hypothetical protein